MLSLSQHAKKRCTYIEARQKTVYLYRSTPHQSATSTAARVKHTHTIIHPKRSCRLFARKYPQGCRSHRPPHRWLVPGCSSPFVRVPEHPPPWGFALGVSNACLVGEKPDVCSVPACRHARVYGHTTTAMYGMSTPHPHLKRLGLLLPVRLGQSLAVRQRLRRRGHVKDPIRRVRLWWEQQTCGRFELARSVRGRVKLLLMGRG